MKSFILDIWWGLESASDVNRPNYASIQQWVGSIQNKALSYFRLFPKHHGWFIADYIDLKL